jgi:hemoglobin-like flavoprotein
MITNTDAPVHGHTADSTGARTDEAPTDVLDDRADCEHCRGTGKALRTSDWLAASLTLFPTESPEKMDSIIAEFYRRLVAADEGKDLGDRVAPLFPADLTTGPALNSKGNRQRDMLLHAIVSLVENFDPDHLNSANMRQLVEILRKEGRNHAAFERPDGTVRGVTRAEYEEVGAVLMTMLREVFADLWLPQFDAGWVEAYEFAMIEMLHAQQHYRMPDGRRPQFGRRVRASVGGAE